MTLEMEIFLQILTYRVGVSHTPCLVLGLKLCVAETALSKCQISLSFSAEIKFFGFEWYVVHSGLESG